MGQTTKTYCKKDRKRYVEVKINFIYNTKTCLQVFVLQGQVVNLLVRFSYGTPLTETIGGDDDDVSSFTLRGCATTIGFSVQIRDMRG